MSEETRLKYWISGTNKKPVLLLLVDPGLNELDFYYEYKKEKINEIEDFLTAPLCFKLKKLQSLNDISDFNFNEDYGILICSSFDILFQLSDLTEDMFENICTKVYTVDIRGKNFDFAKLINESKEYQHNEIIKPDCANLEEYYRYNSDIEYMIMKYARSVLGEKNVPKEKSPAIWVSYNSIKKTHIVLVNSIRLFHEWKNIFGYSCPVKRQQEFQQKIVKISTESNYAYPGSLERIRYRLMKKYFTEEYVTEELIKRMAK